MAARSYTSCDERVSVEDVTGCCRRLCLGDDDESGRAIVNAAIDEALWLFDQATENTFRGVCEEVVRPCVPTDPCRMQRWTREDVALAFHHPEAWLTLCPCDQARTCSCKLPGLRLPYGPVTEIVEVKIDGAVLPDTSYRLSRRGMTLFRVDGDSWPTCQDLTLDDTEVGTWSVTFKHGQALPPGAKRRIASFACEIAKFCNNDPCSLGERFRVTKTDAGEFVFQDDFRAEGLTGDEPLDNWIMNWRGGHARSRPRMIRPGSSRKGVRPWLV